MNGKSVLSKTLMLAMISTTLVSYPCWAKLKPVTFEQLVDRSTAIVIVNVTKVEPAKMKAGTWTYTQKGTVKVERCLKGNVKGTISVYGGMNFECAQDQLKKGRYVLFLTNNKGSWTPCGYYHGIRPIEKGNILPAGAFSKGKPGVMSVEEFEKKIARRLKQQVDTRTELR